MALFEKSVSGSVIFPIIDIVSVKRDGTYLLACLLRKALILAVQGLIMLSEGETYCLALLTANVNTLPLSLRGIRAGLEEERHVRLSSHLGLKDLAMVFHALDVLGRWLLLHGSVDVLVTEHHVGHRLRVWTDGGDGYHELASRRETVLRSKVRRRTVVARCVGGRVAFNL